MSGSPLIGAISGWGPNFAPRGWSFCAGQLLAISQFSAVFSLVGTVYGGDGRTTLRLPDLRNRAPVGAGQSPGTSMIVQGTARGSEDTTLSVLEMPQHNHQIAHNLSTEHPASAQPGTSDTPDATLAPAQLTQRGATQPLLAYGPPDGVTTLQAGAVAGTISAGNAGGGQPFSIVQPLQAIQYIFALEGVFPSRN